MFKNLILSFTFLIYTISYGQILLSKDLVDIKTNECWLTISKNDILLDEYLYLENLDFYEISYLSDSLKINGFVIEPKLKKNLPAIIFNRGGNRDFGALSMKLIIDWTSIIANEGYVVIASQYRGGKDSEGNDEFGGNDVNDVLNLLPILKNSSNVDTSRIGMYGWSRGGIMTYLALMQTSKIKTAIIGGAPSDLTSLINERPEIENLFSELIPDYSIFKERELIKRSPIYRVNEIKKTGAILILHGKKDERVSYAHSEKMFQKLKAQSFDVELIIYENADHILNENRTEKDEKILSWLKLNL